METCRTGALCLNQRTHVALRFELTRTANRQCRTEAGVLPLSMDGAGPQPIGAYLFHCTNSPPATPSGVHISASARAADAESRKTTLADESFSHSTPLHPPQYGEYPECPVSLPIGQRGPSFLPCMQQKKQHAGMQRNATHWCGACSEGRRRVERADCSANA